MDYNNIDHYAVLGLPSGVKLSLKDIQKAYRNQSRKLHPDKHPNDPNATSNFQKLTFSYHVLKEDASVHDRVTMAAAVDPDKEKQTIANLKRQLDDFKAKEEAVAVSHGCIGHRLNPLHVLPAHATPDSSKLGNIIKDYGDHETSTFKKLKKVAVNYGYIGHPLNSLHVLPAHATPDSSKLGNIIKDFDDYETSIFKKLKKVMEIRNQSHGI